MKTTILALIVLLALSAPSATASAPEEVVLSIEFVNPMSDDAVLALLVENRLRPEALELELGSLTGRYRSYRETSEVAFLQDSRARLIASLRKSVEANSARLSLVQRNRADVAGAPESVSDLRALRQQLDEGLTRLAGNNAVVVALEATGPKAAFNRLRSDPAIREVALREARSIPNLGLSSEAAPQAVMAIYWPDDGDLWYDGWEYADSYMKWSSPGGWSVSDPGYEHDFPIYSHYFEYCSSWTNLPNGYNDCPTAGVSEPSGGMWTFSFGSYHAKNIKANTWYFGSWNFGGGYSSQSAFYLNGQENKRSFCPWDNIWCMNGTRSQRLTSGTLYWGKSLYKSW